MFPIHRPRRLRKTETIRRMLRETSLSPDNFIYPLFVTFGKGVKKEISSMPGCFQESVDIIVRHAKEVYSLGIPSVMLFGIPEHKDEIGSGAYAEHGVVQKAIKAIKNKVPELFVITDVCMGEYTSHGHCGVVKEGYVQNDPTLELLSKEAVSHAKAGADMVAPSDMMDGRVEAIRFALIEGGADIVMVKPALAYLDIISDVKDAFDVPVAAYNVSGEYSLVKAAGKLGWIDEKRVMMEILTSIKRAGATLILTYFAKEAAKLLNK